MKGEHRLAFRLFHRRVATGELSSPSLHPGGEVVRWAEARLLTASSFQSGWVAIEQRAVGVPLASEQGGSATAARRPLVSGSLQRVMGPPGFS